MPASPTQVRRLPIGLSTAGAPLVAAALLLVHPKTVTDRTRQLAIIESHTAAWTAVHVIGFFVAVWYIPMLIGLVRVAGSRSKGLGLLALSLGVVGTVSVAAINVVEVVLIKMAEVPAARGQMADLYAQITGPKLFVFPLAIALTAGLCILAFLLWDAETVPTWAAIAIGIGSLVEFVGHPAGIQALVMGGAVLGAAGFARLGYRILRSGNPDVEAVAVASPTGEALTVSRTAR